MQHTDFVKFEAKNRTRASKKLTLPLLHEICEVEFRKDSCLMLYKASFSDEFSSADFFTPKFVLNMPDMHDEPRGIPSKKKEGIIKLLASVPAGKRKFWYDPRVNDSVTDLAESTVESV